MNHPELSRQHTALAYKNDGFLDSNDGRPLRILAEYLEPLAAFRRERIHDTIVFFGSARLREDGPLGRYYAEARELARLVTEWSKSLPHSAHRFVVCSGGGGGIMEAANRGASDAGGKTVGLNIGLPREQRPNPYVTRELLFEFHYFFMRKLWFMHLARALVAFPGGFGTLDELMETLTLAQTRKLHGKIVIVLYGSSYWREVINFDALVRHGTISREDLGLFQFADDPRSALEILQRALSVETAETTPPSRSPPRWNTPRPRRRVHERADRPRHRPRRRPPPAIPHLGRVVAVLAAPSLLANLSAIRLRRSAVGMSDADWRRMVQRFRPFGFVGAGFTGGAVYLLVEFVLLPRTKHVPVDWILRLIGSLVSGPGTLAVRSALEAVVLASALGVHALLSLAFGYLLCQIEDALSFWRAMGASTVFAIGIYLFNFYVMTVALPWFATARGGATVLAHVLFAVATVLTHKTLGESAPTAATGN